MASGDTMFIFTPQDRVSGSAVAGQITAATGERLVLSFDGTTADEDAIFQGVWPSNYDGGGINVVVHYSSDGTVSAAMQFEVSVEKTADAADQDAGGADFGTATDITDTPATTANVLDVTAAGAVSHANCGSPAAGDAMRLRINRDYNHAANTDEADIARIVVTEQ